MMVWVFALMGFMDVPVVLSKWKVPYAPKTSLLRSDGQSLFFHAENVYVFDAQGNLTGDFELDFAPDTAFLGPADTVWIHDGAHRLGRLNENHNLRWQKEIEPPTLAPVAFESYLVYAGENLIQLLDPEDGSPKFSSYHGSRVTGMLPRNGVLLIFDAEGKAQTWSPETGRKETLYEGRHRGLLFLSENPITGAQALAYDGGRLDVFSKNQRRQWSRDYHIKISTPPIWMESNDHPQLVVATHGRAVLAYGKRGEQLARTLVRGRPMALIRWSDRLCLVAPSLVNELIWYDAGERAFSRQKLNNYLTLVLVNGSFILLVDKDAIIRLYQKNGAF